MGVISSLAIFQVSLRRSPSSSSIGEKVSTIATFPNQYQPQANYFKQLAERTA